MRGAWPFIEEDTHRFPSCIEEPSIFQVPWKGRDREQRRPISKTAPNSGVLSGISISLTKEELLHPFSGKSDNLY
jgi:hypothetical protein